MSDQEVQNFKEEYSSWLDEFAETFIPDEEYYRDRENYDNHDVLFEESYL
jgi:hypothetical protein